MPLHLPCGLAPAQDTREGSPALDTTPISPTLGERNKHEAHLPPKNTHQGSWKAGPGFFFYDLASTVRKIKEGYILTIKRIINNHLNGPRLWGEEAALRCHETWAANPMP